MKNSLPDSRVAAFAGGLFLLSAAVGLSQQADTKQADVTARFADALKKASAKSDSQPAEVQKAPVAKAIPAPLVAKREAVAKVEVKEARPALKKAIRAVRPMNDDAQLNALVQQFSPQFRPVLWAEFQVVRVICQPSPAQAKKIARHSETAFQSAVKKYADGMRKPMTMEQRTALDPHKLIQEALLQSVLTELSTEQAARYHEELARRGSHRKQVAIRNLVVKLDHELILDSAQRDKLAEALKAHWSDSWSQSLDALVYDYAFIPNIPSDVVVPLLNDTQKKIWKGIPKNNAFFGQFGMGQVANADDPLEDPDLREARLAITAEGAKNGK
jgi:hypothetical protein